MAQEPEQPVGECDELQDWRVHGQEENINESEDQFRTLNIFTLNLLLCVIMNKQNKLFKENRLLLCSSSLQS